MDNKSNQRKPHRHDDRHFQPRNQTAIKSNQTANKPYVDSGEKGRYPHVKLFNSI